MAREYFCAYHSFLEAMERLDDAERGRLFSACLQYSKTGTSPDLTGNEQFVFPALRSQIDRDNKGYAEKCANNRKNGALGAKRTGANASERPPNAPQGKGEGEDKDKGKGEKDCETPRAKKASRFVPPTTAEVASYVAQRHSPVDPQEFIDFYASKGWLVGKTPMKDWKAACRNAEKWDRWQKGFGKQTPHSGRHALPTGQVSAERAQKDLSRLDKLLGESGEAP